MRIIVTGATGMVGEGILRECLSATDVDAVLVVGRRACGVSHEKLKEILIPDLFNLKEIESRLSGYDGCFFCLGISSVGMKEADFFKTTYTLTLNFAETLARQNNDMTFCYVSGVGTDSTESGKTMWARVKGKTENDLMKLPFKAVYNFRPGFMKASKGAKNTVRIYRLLSWMYYPMKLFTPNFVCTLADVGLAMIQVTKGGYSSHTISVRDIKALAKRS